MLFRKYLIFLLVYIAGVPLALSARDNADTTRTVTPHAAGKKEFDAGKFVIEHVSDAYEWHILTIGHTHISVPLPVIIYSKKIGRAHV